MPPRLHPGLEQPRLLEIDMLQDKTHPDWKPVKARDPDRPASAAVGEIAPASMWRSPGVRIILWFLIALEFAAIFHISSNY